MGFGPDEWGKPFQSIDAYRAIPACSEAIKRHPDERRFVLQLALADIAGDKKAKPLLDELIAQGNTSAMLALAFISPNAEAAELIIRPRHRRSERHDAVRHGAAHRQGRGQKRDRRHPHASACRRERLDPRHAHPRPFL